MREERLFNDGWEFIKLPLGSDLEVAKAEPDAWKSVVLPHDWLIYDTGDLYGDASGWYRKSFTMHKSDARRYLINFDGVYMDSTVYVNDIPVGIHRYGYSAFEYDITEQLRDGSNTIMVEVRHRSPNTRWYSGAGIFRDVTWKAVPLTHIATDGVYITTERETGKRWKVVAETELVTDSEPAIADRSDKNLMGCPIGRVLDKLPDGWEITHDIRLLPSDPVNTGTIARPCAEAVDFRLDDSSHGDNCSICKHPCQKRTEVRVSDVETVGGRTVFYIDNAFMWDVTAPNRYELTTNLVIDGTIVDSVHDIFGLRTAEFIPDRGFVLNGRRVKLNGVCEHHDLGCLGAAFNRDAMLRKLYILKSMGVNAIRTSHNMPARGLMELADELGILIDSESFDMWRYPKTEYDYARFFAECHRSDITSWVRRDRNHPSVIMWSVGNEIGDCHSDPTAPELITELRDIVWESDPHHNAMVTMGSNYMPWKGAQTCTDRLKLAGYNYAEKLYAEHHDTYKDWIIYGSETSSTVQSRGIYHFPYSVQLMSDDDEQCSSLGNCTTSWGAPSTEYVIYMDRDTYFSCGTFIWTGFDYIGEPTPYHTKNSYFGQLDTAGFAKDTYYIYKAEWTDPSIAPFVHVFPYWDFNEGQQIDVRACTNGASVELFVNGISQGIRHIDHTHGREELVPAWQVNYHEGKLEAVAYDAEGNEIARESRCSFGDSYKLECRAFEPTVGHTIFLEIEATDAEGYPVENATDRVNVTVSGVGYLLGLDNGDSTDYEQYKCSSRRLFSGKLLVVIGTTGKSGELRVDLSSDGLVGCTYKTYIEQADKQHPAEADIVAENSAQSCAFDCVLNEVHGDRPVRNIKLTADRTELDGEHRTAAVSARILPASAEGSELIWKVVNDHAVDSNIAIVSAEGDHATVTAIGDGTFRLRCMAAEHGNISVISVIEFKASGIGHAYLDPYDFISGSLYTDSTGDVTNGNEKGVATSRTANSYVGFDDIDFGPIGSDEITLPIFTLSDDPYAIEFWKGRPGDVGSRLLLKSTYQKKMIWNVYQPETYKLQHILRGITSIYIVTDAKFHIKGFSFTRPDMRGQLLEAASCDRIYGDNYVRGEHDVTGIGNNVSLYYEGLSFGAGSVHRIGICGRAVKPNSIRMQITNDAGSTVHMLEFAPSADYNEQCFELGELYGPCTVEFVFLPGSEFDLRGFTFY